MTEDLALSFLSSHSETENKDLILPILNKLLTKCTAYIIYKLNILLRKVNLCEKYTSFTIFSCITKSVENKEKADNSQTA